MNEDILNALRQQDAALRDAIRLSEQELPQMPADLNARVMRKSLTQKAHPQPLPKKEGRDYLKTQRLWTWVAAAASLLLLIGVGLTMMPEEELMKEGQTTTAGNGIMTTVKAELTTTKTTEETVYAESRDEKTLSQLSKFSSSNKTRAKAELTTTKTSKTTEKTGYAGSRDEKKLSQLSKLSLTEQELSSTSQELASVDSPQQTPETLTDNDIPITRPENYKYTPEEIALMKRQANEAYLKWVELELEIAKYNQEQTAQK